MRSYPPTTTIIIITCSGERTETTSRIHLPSQRMMMSFPKTEMTMRTMTRKIGRGPNGWRNKRRKRKRGHTGRMCERASQVPSIYRICAFQCHWELMSWKSLWLFLNHFWSKATESLGSARQCKLSRSFLETYIMSRTRRRLFRNSQAKSYLVLTRQPKCFYANVAATS